MESKTARADSMVGRVLDDRYRIGPKIARGGMATVYQATDLKLERTVAVKIMRSEFTEDESFVKRFKREARSAAQLSHPNVVSVFDTGDDHGTLYLVMEYVPGQTLRSVIRKEAPMSPIRALTLIEQVLQALRAAHRAGLLHRDVKPENALLSDDGLVKVTDFGLARAINSESQHTSANGVLIGTVSYLAPEIVVNAKPDARADVYAAGVLLYEMLTGCKPHEGENPIQVAYKHVNEDVPAPSLRVPALPAIVDALVARATARDMAFRSADAGVLLNQTQRVRQALEQGDFEDEELQAELTPMRTDTQVLEGVWPSKIVDPENLAPQDLTPTDRVFDHEHDSAKHGVIPHQHEPMAPIIKPRKSPQGPTVKQTVQSPRGRGPLLLVSVLLLAGLVGYTGWYMGMGRYQPTPSVLQLTQKAAAKKLEAAGLKFSVVEREYDEQVPAGQVLSTDPDPGERVLKDGTVKAVLSLGPERHAVPDVTNKSYDQAAALLSDATLAVGTTQEVFNEVIPTGQIVAVTPGVGTLLKRGDEVALKVSKGKKPINIRDFTNRSWALGEKRLTRLGFTPQVTEEFNSSVPKGNVVSQSPRKGTGFKGDAITVVVSKGPQMITVPKVVGSGLDAATKALEDAGFNVKVQHSSVYIGLSYVVGQSPDADGKAPLGSTVTLSIV